MFGGARAVTPGSTVVSMISSGASTPNPPGSLPGGSTPLSLPNVVLGTGRPHHLIINVTSGDYDFNKPLNADWVEIHTPGGNTTENSGGTVTADLLTGSAGGDALFMQSGNQVTWLAGGAPSAAAAPAATATSQSAISSFGMAYLSWSAARFRWVRLWQAARWD